MYCRCFIFYVYYSIHGTMQSMDKLYKIHGTLYVHLVQWTYLAIYDIMMKTLELENCHAGL